ncbi:helix-turn-helix domain-containing protein [Microbacterium sp. No. 7]|uniref:helix-turn-helix domain-containing protein n=1 Tax=Microbacterium sp. No. 7 TaxID=1714373 RepID=UPI0006D1958D|nr:helix-turn-helix domain-containing protein [Microbacterium sp. No. 7]
MALVAELRSLGRLLGLPNDNPVTARRFRSTAITTHALDVDAPWSWDTQPELGNEMALLAFVESPVQVAAEDGWATSADAALFLHPGHSFTVSAERSTSTMCVWVPWDALEELDDGTLNRSPVLSATPLLSGLRAFAGTFVRQGDPPTMYTDYLVEKLLAEMVFGTVLEAGRGEPVAARGSAVREARPLERARTLMVLRRADAAFGVKELAAELHLSTRQLQREFAAVGSTPADELRKLRAELAQQLLGDETYDALTVDEIAAHSGFGTAAALRRAFVTLGLSSPRRRR